MKMRVSRLVLAAYSLTAASASKLQAIDAQQNLRGLNSKKEPQLSVLDGHLAPVAPQDSLEVGTLQGSAASVPVLSKGDLEKPNVFPKVYSKALFKTDIDGDGEEEETTVDLGSSEQHLRGQKVSCHSSPKYWKDAHGNGCATYKKHGWCFANGTAGPGWNQEWGSFVEWSTSQPGTGALGACCACGGGLKMIEATDAEVSIHERTLLAPEDALPVDSIPVGAKEMEPLIAPHDDVPSQFAQYISETHQDTQEDTLYGLSARFYSVPPNNECDGPKAEASQIDRALDYKSQSLLKWPSFLGQETGVFFGKWTGSINIIKGGSYVFDLDLGYDSLSSVKIDGKEILTVGQCRFSKDSQTCAMKRCSWIEAESKCVPPSTQSSAAAAALISFEAGAPAAAPASAPEPDPQEATAIPNATLTADFPPQFPAVEGTPGTVELKAGGHCLEIVLSATPNSRAISLKYLGPDTANTTTVIPAHVLYCDPVIQACEKPELKTCSNFRPSCKKEKVALKEVKIPQGWTVPKMLGAVEPWPESVTTTQAIQLVAAGAA
jgi:hypothetical protein